MIFLHYPKGLGLPTTGLIGTSNHSGNSRLEPHPFDHDSPQAPERHEPRNAKTLEPRQTIPTNLPVKTEIIEWLLEKSKPSNTMFL
jgi:hypothetical protein